MTDLYTVWTVAGGYRVVKFDFLLNVQAVYYIKGASCECFQAYGCRHRKIVNIFAVTNRTNKGYFYCYDEDTWELPVTEAFKRARKTLKSAS